MGTQAPTSASIQESDRRRSERVLLVVPVQVDWNTPAGKHVSERAETEVVNAHGALLRMKTAPPDSSTLEITHSKTQQKTSARVVRVQPPQSDGRVRVAVELSVQSGTYWGITIPESAPPPPALPKVPPIAAPKVVGKEPKAKPPKEAARKGEVTMRVPMRIRTDAGRIEVTRTENLSRTAARFFSDKDYPVGSTLFVAAPYTPGEEPLETKAVVEGVEPVAGSAKKSYAIKFV